MLLELDGRVPDAEIGDLTLRVQPSKRKRS
jgi:hypothetical protein